MLITAGHIIRSLSLHKISLVVRMAFFTLFLSVVGCGGSSNTAWITITEPTSAETYTVTDSASIHLAGNTFRSPMASSSSETKLVCDCEGWECLLGNPTCEEITVYDYDSGVTVTVTNLTTGASTSLTPPQTYWSAEIPLTNGKNVIEVHAIDVAGNQATDQITIYTSDTIPPTLQSRHPANDAIKVAVNSVITASFSEVIDTSTINASSFTVSTGGSSIAGTLSFSADASSAIFTPADRLLYNTTYTVTLSSSIKDLAGHTLSTYAWNFTTGFVDPPSNVQSSGGDGEITISWDAVADADYYNIYFDTSPGLTTVTVTLVNAGGITETFYTHTGLNNGTQYYYIVTAVNGSGEGEASSETSAMAGLHWIKQFGTVNNDYGQGIAVDSAGNSYLTGSTSGDLAGTASAGYSDVFIAKYDMSANQLWIKQFGSAYDDSAHDIAVDSDGNSYITGNTSRDVFIAKYDTDGNQLWIRQFGSAATDKGLSIAVDANGNSYLTGNTSGDLAGTGNAGYSDVFITRYDTTGNQIWIKQFGTAYVDYGKGIALDTSGNSYLICKTGTNGYYSFITKYDSSGNQLWKTTETMASGTDIALDSNNIYVTGYTYIDLAGTGYAGGVDAYIRKHDASGNLVWTRQFGSYKLELGSSITVNATGDIYLTGYTDGDLADTGNIENKDVFITKYDRLGSQLWLNQFGTPEDDYGTDIIIDINGNAYLTGSTSGDLAGSGNAGMSDIFIQRIFP